MRMTILLKTLILMTPLKQWCMSAYLMVELTHQTFDNVIGSFHEYADHGKGRLIHAAAQMECSNCKVD